jgi:hypothetical protein
MYSGIDQGAVPVMTGGEKHMSNLMRWYVLSGLSALITVQTAVNLAYSEESKTGMYGSSRHFVPKTPDSTTNVDGSVRFMLDFLKGIPVSDLNPMYTNPMGGTTIIAQTNEELNENLARQLAEIGIRTPLPETQTVERELSLEEQEANLDAANARMKAYSEVAIANDTVPSEKIEPAKDASSEIISMVKATKDLREQTIKEATNKQSEPGPSGQPIPVRPASQ